MPWIPVQQNLADKPTLDDGPPSQSRREALNTAAPKLGRWTCLSQWTTQLREHICLEYQYTELGTQTYFGMIDPPINRSIDALNTATQKLGRQTYFGRWTPPSEWEVDALNTATPNLADEPTLANGSPQSIKKRCLEYLLHQSWQMNLFWLRGPSN